MTRTAPALALALGLGLALSGSPGCFVWEELDRGAELMERDSAGSGDVAAAPPPGEALLDGVRDGVASTRSWWDALWAPDPPSDPIADCRLDGARAFLRESDCLARGGWVRP